MSKYIDAEAFFKVINTLPYKDTSYPDASAYNGAISDVADMLTHFPAADVVEVVRCKDCKWFDDIGCAIRIVDDSDRPSENDFCSFAERKDNG